MIKSKKVVSVILIFVLSMTLFTGCKKNEFEKTVDEMKNKYGSYVVVEAYKGLDYTASDNEVTDESIEMAKQSLLDQYSEFEQILEATVSDGDTVNIDYVGSVDGVEFEGGSTGGTGTLLTIGSGSYIVGFEESIIGKEVGETFDLEVTFPEDYGNAELAGKEAVFVTTINFIQGEKIEQEFSDAFVMAFTEYETVALWEEETKKQMTEQNKEYDENYNKSAVMQVVMEKATMSDYPEQEIQELVDDEVKNIETAATDNQMAVEDYLVASYGFATQDEFKEYIKEMAKTYIAEKAVIGYIAKQEKISITKEDVKTFEDELVAMYQLASTDEIYEYYEKEDIMFLVLQEKVVDFLVANNNPVFEQENQE